MATRRRTSRYFGFALIGLGVLLGLSFSHLPAAMANLPLHRFLANELQFRRGGDMTVEIHADTDSVTADLIMLDIKTGATVPSSRFTVDEDGDFVASGTGSVGGQLDMNSNKIVDVADPTAAQDAATKAYVDSAAGGSANKIQEFTSSGNWTRPSGVDAVFVILIGGGGGGGGGGSGSGSSSARDGGGGGGGGSGQVVTGWIDVTGTPVGNNIAVTVGSGGNGGNGGTGTSGNNGSSGNSGNDGGDTSFGAHLTAPGGLGGGNGTGGLVVTSPAGGADGNGGAGGSANSVYTGFAYGGTSGGDGGGGADSTQSSDGGVQPGESTNGTAGTQSSSSGGGGGGGAGGFTGIAGNGSNGTLTPTAGGNATGLSGGGGGGGGSSGTTSTSSDGGDGGNGAPGKAIIVWME